MQTNIIWLAIAVLATACQNETPKNNSGNSGNDGKQHALATETRATAETASTKASGFWEKLVWKEYRDNTGAVTVSVPYPSSWTVNDRARGGEPSVTGPNGIRITDFPFKSFMYTNDPQTQQLYYQTGQPLRALPSIDQLIQQDFVPLGNSNGLTFVRHYEVPEVSKIDKWYSDQLYKAVPTQSHVVAIGTEWKKADGSPYFFLIHLNASASSNMQNWYYYTTGLEAEPAHFEKAKKQFLFALANARYELEPIMAFNQKEAQAAGQSWAAHNQRMAQNQAAFESQQRAHVNKSNAINDAIMSGWRESNASSDRQHERTIDAINERTNVVDASNGQRYKVDAGANNYWMNSNGEYISTDIHDYNPNLDDNMNAQRWQELKEIER